MSEIVQKMYESFKHEILQEILSWNYLRLGLDPFAHILF